MFRPIARRRLGLRHSDWWRRSPHVAQPSRGLARVCTTHTPQIRAAWRASHLRDRMTDFARSRSIARLGARRVCATAWRTSPVAGSIARLGALASARPRLDSPAHMPRSLTCTPSLHPWRWPARRPTGPSVAPANRAVRCAGRQGRPAQGAPDRERVAHERDRRGLHASATRTCALAAALGTTTPVARRARSDHEVALLRARKRPSPARCRARVRGVRECSHRVGGRIPARASAVQ